ncbi:tetratricopeptide repeat protein [Desulfosediminicola sp.]|uniref:tetratricopeptide repeat protein n=1 Tax=Desulfosediminicola sp. TaxID=2886825 RepID=UPI003AF26909
MTVRMLVLVLLFIGISQSAAAQAEDKAGIDFALETEAVLASRQIQQARMSAGKLCSSQEVYHWEMLVQKYLSYERGKEAEALWFDLLQECAQQSSYLHPDTLQVAEAIVRFYGAQAQPHKVNPFLEELMLMGEQQAGNREENLLPLLDTCSGLYGAAGDIGKQEEVLRRGLAIVIDSNRASRLDVAQRKVHLADFLFEHERMPEAEELYLQNAPLLLEELSEKSDKSADLRDRLAKIHISRNEWAAAEPHIQILNKYIHDKLGEESPVSIRYLGYLAFIYANQGKYADARQTLARAIPLAERLEGEDRTLLADLKEFQSQLDHELDYLITQKAVVCSEESVRLYQQKTQEWQEIFREISERVESLKRNVEKEEAYDQQIEEARQAIYTTEPKPGETRREAQLRGRAHYNRVRLSRPNLWGEAGFGRACLKELAAVDHDLNRYLNGAEELYQGWNEVVRNCSEEDNNELFEASMRYEAFVDDWFMEESMLRQNVLDPLYTSCTTELANSIWAEQAVGQVTGHGDENQFCGALAYIMEGSSIEPEDIEQLPTGELRLLRNAVFAKQGRSFKAQDLQSFFYDDGALPCGFYFRQKAAFTASALSDADRKNVSLLKSLE